ncbi:MAG: hypothetical protein WKF91_11500 [Segetibacter sp.]
MCYSLYSSGGVLRIFVIKGEWKYLGTQYFDLANTIKQSSDSLLNTGIGVAARNFSIMFGEEI